MANRIITKNKSTTGAPANGDLVEGELAINTADQKLYSKDATTIFELTDHDALTNYIANEHIDWTNATDNFLTTGTVQGSTFRTQTQGFDVGDGTAAKDPFIGFYDTAAYGVRQGIVSFSDTLGITIRNEVVSTDFTVQTTDAGSALRTSFYADPDGVTLVRGTTDLGLQVKGSGTAEYALYAVADGTTVLYYNANGNFRTHSAGISVNASSNPFIAFYADYSNATRTAFLQSTAISGYWRNEQTSSNMNISSWNSADASVTHFDGDPDAGVSLYYQGNSKLQTLTNGANVTGTLFSNSITCEASSGNTALNIQKATAADQGTVTYRNELGAQRYIFGMAGGTDDDFFIGKYNNAGDTWTGSALYVDGVTGQVDLRWPTDQTKLSVIATGVDVTGALSATGAVTGSNLNVSDWDTAFGWGDHSLAGYTSNTGTVTSVGTNTGLSGTVTTSGNLSLDLPSLALGGTLVGTDWLIASNGGVQNRQVISSIPLSIFNNNSGWTSNTGTVTGTGTTNTIATWNGTTAINTDANSFLIENAVDKTATETISGAWRFDGQVNIDSNSNASPLRISRTGTASEEARHGLGDAAYDIYYQNDEAAATMRFTIENTDTESGGGAAANTHVVEFVGNSTTSLFDIRDGTHLRIRDSLDTSFVSISHDANDLNITGSGAVDIDIAGYTNLQLGAMNIVTSGLVDGKDVSTLTSNTGTVTSVGGTGTVSGLTLTGTVTSSGNLTLGGAITGFATTSHVHTFDSLTSKTSGTGNYQTSGDMIADNFEATGLGPTTTPGASDLYMGGYGIIGDRSAQLIYVTNANSNASSRVGLATGGSHSSANVRLQVWLETATGRTSAGQIKDHGGTLRDIGFNVLPTFNFNASDTLQARHCGHATGKTNTSLYTLTGPASSDVDFPVGGVAHVYNLGTSGNYLISDTGTCTMYVCDGTAAPQDIVGTCTLAPGGMVSLWRYSTTAIYITGTGITV